MSLGAHTDQTYGWSCLKAKFSRAQWSALGPSFQRELCSCLATNISTQIFFVKILTHWILSSSENLTILVPKMRAQLYGRSSRSDGVLST